MITKRRSRLPSTMHIAARRSILHRGHAVPLPGAVGPVGGGAQEVIHVIPDDPVEHARLRVARLVASPGTVHAPA